MLPNNSAWDSVNLEPDWKMSASPAKSKWGTGVSKPASGKSKWSAAGRAKPTLPGNPNDAIGKGQSDASRTDLD